MLKSAFFQQTVWLDIYRLEPDIVFWASLFFKEKILENDLTGECYVN